MRTGADTTCQEGGRIKGRRKGRVGEKEKEGGTRLMERHSQQLV
jgi:hypothetical protein